MMNFTQLRENLLTHLQQIVRDRDPFLSTAGHFYVQQYICEHFRQFGDIETHTFTYRNRSHNNLILNLPAAASTTRPPILVAAHYDTVPGTVGADDNASGVALLLELVRVFATQPAQYPLRFVAFDLEELGLLGSRAYATTLQQQGEKLRLMLSLEMVGYCDRTPQSQTYPSFLQYLYPNRGDFIALVGNWQIIPDLLRMQRQIRSVGNLDCQWLPIVNQGRILPLTRASDHSPFWDCGYPALMVTDTAYLRNPHYHLSSDRLETLDLDFMTSVCWGLIAAIRHL